MRKEKEHVPVESLYECHTLATPETWQQALEHEKVRYAKGYCYIAEWVKIRKEYWKKGRWVNQENQPDPPDHPLRPWPPDEPDDADAE